MTGETPSVREELEGAARDLWTMPVEVEERSIVFIDRRHMKARVEQGPDGRYRISWETEDGDWIRQENSYESPREAAFRAYQGPH